MYFEYYQELYSGQWRWRLRSANHEIIASGESYKNQADCLHAINLVQSTNVFTPVKLVQPNALSSVGLMGFGAPR